MNLKIKHFDKAVKPVLINEYLESSGRTKQMHAQVEFKVYSTEENKKRDEQALEMDQHIIDSVTNWSGLKDEGGAEIVFSQDNLKELLAYSSIKARFWQAYIECQTGIDLAKN